MENIALIVMAIVAGLVISALLASLDAVCLRMASDVTSFREAFGYQFGLSLVYLCFTIGLMFIMNYPKHTIEFPRALLYCLPVYCLVSIFAYRYDVAVSYVEATWVFVKKIFANAGLFIVFSIAWWLALRLFY